ncbi:MAG: hypothetical protein RLY70_1617, partial [Planctomycetota bacterium]
ATGTAPQRELLIGATDVSALVGDAGGAGTADDVGVALREGTLTAYIAPSGVYAFDASAAVSLVGVDGVTLSGTVNVQKNTTGAAVNRSITVNGETRTLDLPADANKIAATLVAEIDNYVEIRGAFEMEQTEYMATLADDSTVGVNLMKLSGTGLSGFVGVNGPASNPEAIGLSLTNLDFGLVVASPSENPTGADLRRWTAVRAKAANVSILGGDAIEGSLTALTLDLNRAGGTLNGSPQTTVIDFSGEAIAFGTPANANTTISYGDERFGVSATATNIAVGGFVELSGSLEITSSDKTLKLSDGSDISAKVLTIGGSNINGFAGLNAGTANKSGLTLTGVNFALAMVTDAMDNARQWTSLGATATSAVFEGVAGFNVTGSALAIEVNRADEDGVVVDFKSTPLDVGIGGANTLKLDLDGGLGATAMAKGTLSLDAMGLFRIDAVEATVRKSLGTVALANGTIRDVNLLSVGFLGADAFAGVSGVGDNGSVVDHGLKIEDADIALAIATDASDATRNWRALSARSSNVSAVGLNDVTLSASNLKVEINQADSTGMVVDWARLPLRVSDGPTPLTMNLDGQLGELSRVRGQLNLNVGGFFSVSGEFAVETTTQTVTLADDARTSVEVEVLTIGARRVEAFAGVNGDTGTETDRVGLKMSGVEFALAMASTKTAPAREWTALSASATQVEFQGLSDSFAKVSAENLRVDINRPDSTGAGGVVIDFAASPLVVSTGVAATRTIDFAGTDGAMLKASGDLSLDIGGFFQVAGSLTVSTTTATVKPYGREAIEADLITVGGSGLSAFAGVGAGTDNAIGVNLDNVAFALAIATSQTTPSDRWTVLSAEAGQAAFEGVDSVTLSGKSLQVNINLQNANSTDDATDVLDFSSATYRLAVPTGNGSTRLLAFDGAQGELIEASGSLDLEIDEFLSLSGDLYLRRSNSTLSVVTPIGSTGGDTAGTPVQVAMLTVGGSQLEAFAGVAGGTAQARGFSISGLDFGLVLATDRANSSRSWLALEATADSAAFIGMKGVAVETSALALKINQPAGDQSLLDFGTQSLSVPTGTGVNASPITLDMAGAEGELLEASGSLSVSLFGYFHSSGNYSLRKSTESVVLSNGDSKNVDLMLLAAENATAFVGVNGGTANQVGMSLTGLTFGLAFATDPVDPTQSWTALQATAGDLSFTGLTGIDFPNPSDGQPAISNVKVLINQKSASGTVIDFAAKPLTIDTGASDVTLAMAGSVGELLALQADLNMSVAGFFEVRGQFSLSKSSGEVALSDGSKADVDILSFGGQDISAFAGYDRGTANSMGFTLENVDFGLAILTDRADPTRKWTSLQAKADTAAILGIDDLTVAGTDLSVMVNRGVAAGHAGAPASSGNTAYRLAFGATTVGTLAFQYQGSTGSATIGLNDSDNTIVATLRTALESMPSIGVGNVSITGTRATGFALSFVGTLAGKDVDGLTVSTPETTSGSVTATDESAASAGVNEVQTIRISKPRQPAPVIATTVTQLTAGAMGLGEVQSITITTANGASGSYRVSYNGVSRDIRFAQNDITTNRNRLREALAAITGDSNVSVSFDQGSTTLSQRYFARFSNDPDLFTAEATTLSATITVQVARAATGSANERQRVTLAIGEHAGTYQLALPFHGAIYKTASLSFAATASEIQSALTTALAAVGGDAGGTAVVTRVDQDGVATLEIDFAGALAKQNLENLQVFTNATPPVASGTFKLSIGAESTSPISLAADLTSQAAQIQSALESLGGVGAGNVTVSAVAGSTSAESVFRVEFQGASGNRNIADLQVVEATLTYATAVAETVSQGQVGIGEVQRVAIDYGSADGRFNLSLSHGGSTYTTNWIPRSAKPTDVQTAINTALVSMAGASASVLSWNGGELRVAFNGTLAGADVSTLTGAAVGSIEKAVLSKTANGYSREAVPAVSSMLVVDYSPAGKQLSIVNGLTLTMDGEMGEMTQIQGHSVVDIGVASLTGDFSFVSTKTNNVNEFLVGASGLSVFVGYQGNDGVADDIGVSVENGNLLGFITRVGGSRVYAVDMSGNASLRGVDGLTLDGAMSVQRNTTGAAVQRQIKVGSVERQLNLAAGVSKVGGTVSLVASDFVSLSGDFAVSRAGNGSKLLIGAQNVSTLLGTGAETTSESDDFGLKLTNGRLGMVIYTSNSSSKYAYSASGTIAFAGLPGLTISGDVDVRRNATGQAVTEAIPVGNSSVNVSFPTSANVQGMSGTVTITAAEVFEIAGSMSASKLRSGDTLVDISQASLKVLQSGSEVFGIGGRARFVISKSDGFRLLDAGVQTVSAYGLPINTIPGNLPDLDVDPESGGSSSYGGAWGGTPQAGDGASSVAAAGVAFENILGGRIDSDVLNRQGYIDVVFTPPTGEEI